MTNNLQGRRLLWKLAEEELMSLGSCCEETKSVSEEEKVWWASPPPLLTPARDPDCRPAPTSSFPPLQSEPLVWEGEQVCGSVERRADQWEGGRREELEETKAGSKRRTGGIFCGVENTRGGQAQAFVIFVPSHLFPRLTSTRFFYSFQEQMMLMQTI